MNFALYSLFYSVSIKVLSAKNRVLLVCRPIMLKGLYCCWVAVGAACWSINVIGSQGVIGMGICVLGGVVAVG
jgi:hypothetical protein